jgi:DNA-binding MarR family transcriptional regulator
MSKRETRQSTAAGVPDTNVRNVLDAIRQIVRVLRLASRDAEKHVGLSAAQLFVLQKLAEDRALSVNELAVRTHTHQSSVSVVVQRLVDRRLVSRQRSEKDARQLELSVTGAGRAVLKAAPEATQDRLIAALRDMPPAEVGRLSGSLKKLLGRLGIDPAEPASMLFEDEENHARKKRN